jgi:hypothetical protein
MVSKIKLSPPVFQTGKFISQKERVFRSLHERPLTRLQVSKITNVPLQNTCRIIAGFRKAGLVSVVRVGVCPVSGARAEFISTHPSYRAGEQVKLFELPLRRTA